MSHPVSIPRRADPRHGLPLWGGLIAAVAILFAVASAYARPTPDSFADLAEKLLPSVVNISTTQVVRNPFNDKNFRFPQFQPGSPFEEFFREFFDRNRPSDNNNGNDDEEAPRVTSLGSGFVIDASGIIVTNNHVIAEAEEITVTLSDGTEVNARIIGRDTKVDVAVLRVDTDHDLPAVKFGNSEIQRVGDWVLAIGNPYGLGGTVTAGIISARGRNINAGPYDDFIQVDASINRGNSGGPLFNIDGEVIGINTAIYSPSGGSVGIGFAIPSSLAKKIIDDLIEFGQPRRGWLGVSIQVVTEEIADSLGLKEARGALISNVVEGDPADKAGIVPGDVVLEFNGQEIETSRHLQRVVADTNIANEVPVVIWRGGKRRKLQVVVGKMKEDTVEVASAAPTDGSSPGDDQVAVLGMVLAEISPTLRKRLELDDNLEGVLVMEVQSNSNAADVGVRRGDIIIEAARVRVSDPRGVEEQVEKIRQDSERKSVLLGLQRQGQGFIYIAVRIEES